MTTHPNPPSLPQGNRLRIELKEDGYWLHILGNDGKSACINITPRHKEGIVMTCLKEASLPPAAPDWSATKQEHADIARIVAAERALTEAKALAAKGELIGGSGTNWPNAEGRVVDAAGNASGTEQAAPFTPGGCTVEGGPDLTDALNAAVASRAVPISEREPDLTMQPEPKHPTLWRYFDNAHKKQITYHSIGVNQRPDGGYHFYIHPQAVSGDTEDYLVWPDPFNWSDMIVNRKDSPAPDVEKFKALLAREFPPTPPKTSPQGGDKL
jgi:hypothetical protein